MCEWIDAAGLTEGPLLRGIDRWGHIADEALHPNSLIPLLRRLLTCAGLPDAEEVAATPCAAASPAGPMRTVGT